MISPGHSMGTSTGHRTLGQCASFLGGLAVGSLLLVATLSTWKRPGVRFGPIDLEEPGGSPMDSGNWSTQQNGSIHAPAPQSRTASRIVFTEYKPTVLVGSGTIQSSTRPNEVTIWDESTTATAALTPAAQDSWTNSSFAAEASTTPAVLGLITAISQGLSPEAQVKYAESNLWSVSAGKSSNMTADYLKDVPTEESQHLKYLLMEPVDRNVNDHNYTYILEETSLCDGSYADVTKPLLFIAVHTAVGNFVARKKIRDTWGSKAVLHRAKSVMLFFMGNSRTEAEQKLVDDESREFHDIIQESYIDRYETLTIKTRAIFRFLTDRCQNLQFDFLLKTDDDVVHDLDSTSTYLTFLTANNRTSPSKTIYCFHLVVNDIPPRTRVGKWLIPPEQYPGRIYPPYCYGTGYFIPRDLIEPMYNMSLRTRQLWIEDVFWTGFVARNLGYVRHVMLPKQDISAINSPPEEIVKGRRWLVHGLSDHSVHDMFWPAFQSRRNLTVRSKFVEEVRIRTNLTLTDADFDIL